MIDLTRPRTCRCGEPADPGYMTCETCRRNNRERGPHWREHDRALKRRLEHTDQRDLFEYARD